MVCNSYSVPSESCRRRARITPTEKAQVRPRVRACAKRTPCTCALSPSPTTGNAYHEKKESTVRNEHRRGQRRPLPISITSPFALRYLNVAGDGSKGTRRLTVTVPEGVVLGFRFGARIRPQVRRLPALRELLRASATSPGKPDLLEDLQLSSA